MLCSSCYYENEKDALFCNRCGRELKTGEQERESALMEEDVFSDYVREKLSDKYRITRILGRGGMAVVFEAIELQLNRKVALKALPMEHAHSMDLVRRFKQEAQLAAGLHHPHIIPIYSVGSVERIHYFTMAYLEGGALEERIKKGMYLKDAISIVEQVADALNYAHAKKLIHRDIKPANIMFDEHGSAFVVDFGIAKAVVNTMVTATQSFFGTPHYMSPEQVVDERIDSRSDLYSLGVIFYQMVTGRFPFDGTEALSVMYKHVNESATPPNRIHNIPDQVSDIIMKLLAKDRDERYQTGQALMLDMQSLPQTIAGPRQAPLNTHTGAIHNSNPDLAQTIKVTSVAVELAPPKNRASMKTNMADGPFKGKFNRVMKGKRSTTMAMGGFALLLLILLAFLFTRSPNAPDPNIQSHVTVDEFARGGMFHNRDQSPRPVLNPTPEIMEESPQEAVPQQEPERPIKKAVKPKPAKIDPLKAKRNKVQNLLKEMGQTPIKAGSFEMGGNSNFNWAERPVHTVTLDSFILGSTEVTQKLWSAIMETNLSCERGPNLPVTNVTWDQCQEFIQKLNALTGDTWRLPTEAEWEYACQFAGEATLDAQAWYSKNSNGSPKKVKSLEPNSLGLYDMQGNVSEWVADYYGKRYYKNSPSANPKGPDSGKERVIRGGNWDSKAGNCQCFKRSAEPPSSRSCELGFRLAM